MRWAALAACAAVLALTGHKPLQATVVANVLAASGAAAPGGGTYTTNLNDPRVNAGGQVAFTAGLTGGVNHAIFRFDGPIGTRIVQHLAAAPLGGNYSGLSSQPTISSNGKVAFFASLSGTSSSSGGFRHDAASDVAIARVGDPTPAGGTYSSVGFVGPVNSSGQVTVNAGIAGGSSPEGVFLNDGTTAITIGLVGAPAPGGGNYSTFNLPDLNDSGQVAFQATMTGGSSAVGIFRNDGVSAIAIARLGGSAPGGGTYSGSLSSSPRINASGQVSFRSGISGVAGGTLGVFRHDGVSGVLIARQGAAAPAGGNYNIPSDVTRLNSSGQVAFQSTLTSGSSASGVFRHDGTTGVAIALQGMTAPGTLATFASFNDPLINNAGIVALRATLTLDVSTNTTNDTGFWFGTSTGNLELFIREGDTLLVNGVNRTVSQLPTNFAFSNLGIAWRASFTDGSAAIIYSTFTAIPEARAWLMLLLPSLFALAAISRVRTLRRRCLR